MEKNTFKDLVVKAKTDDNAAEIVIRYLMNKYSEKLLKKYFFYKIGDKKDILQYARIGAWLGIKYYKPDFKNVNVEMYLFMNMQNRIITAIKTSLRDCRHPNNECYFYKKVDGKYKNVFELRVDELDVEQDFIKKEFSKILRNIPLSETEKIVMEYKINRDMSYKTISEITGLSAKTIDNAYTRIKKKVKNSKEIKEYLARQ